MSWSANGRAPFLDWGSVPGFDPENPRTEDMRYVFHMTNLTPEQIEELEDKGWVPVDVRLMPDDTDDDKRAQIKATLSGIRHGSIEFNSTQMRMLSEEMKIFKLNKGEEASTDVQDPAEAEDLEAILELTGNSPQAKIALRRYTDEENQPLHTTEIPGENS